VIKMGETRMGKEIVGSKSEGRIIGRPRLDMA
jgi:hypothetical protein